MTVKYLINELQQLAPDAHVFFETSMDDQEEVHYLRQESEGPETYVILSMEGPK